MTWTWWQPDPTSDEHREAWWAESDTLHLTVCRDRGGDDFHWLVCTTPAGDLRASGLASGIPAAKQAAEDAATRTDRDAPTDRSLPVP